jgi:hypothetical protein
MEISGPGVKLIYDRVKDIAGGDSAGIRDAYIHIKKIFPGFAFDGPGLKL